MNINKKISEEIGVKEWQISNARALIEDGKTLPFIARYRKEITGSLNETQLRKIFDLLEYLKKLENRRKEILKSIEEQGKLTEELKKKIYNAEKLIELEDLYLPYKRKRKTKADIAIENGLNDLAIFLETSRKKDSDFVKKFVNEKVKTIEDAINGAKDIITQKITEKIEIRTMLRDKIKNEGYLISKKSKHEDISGVYEDYYDFKTKFRKLKAYQILALKRGQKNKILNLSLEFENDPLYEILKKMGYRSELAYFDELMESATNALKNYLMPSLFNEIFSEKLEEAEKRSAEIFAKNLRNLMLQKPLRNKRILAIDPGYRTGCKVVALDEYGNVLNHTVIYPTPPHSKKEESESKLIKIIKTYALNYVVIGNGTASHETREFVNTMIKDYGLKIKYAIVSEDGASVYSASKTAVEEFPQYDVTTRGAISIGRRVQDPIAELVKIPPQSIGVGMYQHDLNAKTLNFVLKREVESVVNYVGVNLNTASKHLLKYISGLNTKTAENIVKYREENGPFKNRKELLKVPGIGPKAYEQAAGFCRIPNSDNPLDNTIIHPEKYDAALKVIKYFHTSIENFSHEIEAEKIDYDKLSKELKIARTELEDIVKGLLSRDLDPRDEMPQIKFIDKMVTIDDLKVGEVVEGRITNVVDFGAFVDIGIKNSGLLHKSNISKEFVEDPTEILNVGQIIKVRIISIDKERKRIGLSLKNIF